MPSYAATVSDCFKNTAEQASIVAITRSTTIGKHTASSAAATPRVFRDECRRVAKRLTVTGVNLIMDVIASLRARGTASTHWSMSTNLSFAGGLPGALVFRPDQLFLFLGRRRSIDILVEHS